MENAGKTLKYLTIKTIHRVAKEQMGNYHLLNESQLLYLVEAVGGKLGGTEMFPTLTKKAAAYAYHIIAGHTFVDGNKRIGITCALQFLKLNGCSLRLGIDDSIVELGLGIANRTINDIEVIADHLQSWLEPQTNENNADGGI